MRITNNYFKNIADYCGETYGIQVDEEEGFFCCVECGEPIYRCDWGIDDFFPDGPGSSACCPVCEAVLYNAFEEGEPIDLVY